VCMLPNIEVRSRCIIAGCATLDPSQRARHLTALTPILHPSSEVNVVIVVNFPAFALAPSEALYVVAYTRFFPRIVSKLPFANTAHVSAPAPRHHHLHARLLRMTTVSMMQ
jgi:hypothetical protein